MLKLRHWQLLFLIGSVLTITGSFMKWWCQGDLGYYCTRGIQFDPITILHPSNDNGGIFIVVLTIILTLLAFGGSQLMKYPSHFLVPGLLTLYLISTYKIINVKLQDQLDRSTASIHIEDGLSVIRLGVVIMMLSSAAIILSRKKFTTIRIMRQTK